MWDRMGEGVADDGMGSDGSISNGMGMVMMAANLSSRMDL